MGINSLANGIILRRIYHYLQNVLVIPDFCNDIERSGAITISYYDLFRRVASIGYATIFKKAIIKVSQASFFTLDVRKIPPFVLFCRKCDLFDLLRCYPLKQGCLMFRLHDLVLVVTIVADSYWTLSL